MPQVVQGFSLTNRWLLYTSLMLSPAQSLSGMGSNCPTNIGFLAYNWYTQYAWYNAIKAKQLHALSLLPVHFNLIYVITYLSGVTSGNIFIGVILGFGTAGLVVFNTISAWTSWATNMPEGYHVYQFFFFGWRRLTHGWHTFFLLWQIGDSIFAFGSVIGSIAIAISTALDKDEYSEWDKYLAILWGPPAVLFAVWPLIMWTELIINRNQIESETDMVAVWLFVAQVAAMLIPGCSPRPIVKGISSGRRRIAGLIPLPSFRRKDSDSGKSATDVPMANIA